MGFLIVFPRLNFELVLIGFTHCPKAQLSCPLRNLRTITFYREREIFLQLVIKPTNTNMYTTLTTSNLNQTMV